MTENSSPKIHLTAILCGDCHTAEGKKKEQIQKVVLKY